MSFYGGFFFPLIDSAKIRKIFLYTKNLDKKRWFMMILDKIDSKKKTKMTAFWTVLWFIRHFE